MLSDQKFLIGVTGAIAAYKSVELVRRLREQGALVRVVMTEVAKAFIAPLTFQAVSGYPVAIDPWASQSQSGMEHIDLARWCDFVLIAPASADFISRLAQGQANDLLTTLCLATRAPIAVAPSMNQQMWRNKITQLNVGRLREVGISVWGPGIGAQACGDNGPGRMLEPDELINRMKAQSLEKTLLGSRVLITAGPTHEAIDPIRYLTNGSSGKMGYALAEAAATMGAEVTLISGPTPLIASQGINCINVVTATQMLEAVMQQIAHCDVFIGAAAVSDYRPERVASQKIKKTDAAFSLNLIRNPDIISAVGKLPTKPFVVGFALETDHHFENATSKLKQKNMDLIVLNSETALQNDKNAVVVMDHTGIIKEFPISEKMLIASELMKLVSARLPSPAKIT